MTTSATTLGELDAGAECPKDSARGDNREQRRKQGQDACEQRAEREEADEDGDERDLDRQPGIELLIVLALLRAAIAGNPVTQIL